MSTPTLVSVLAKDPVLLKTCADCEGLLNTINAEIANGSAACVILDDDVYPVAPEDVPGLDIKVVGANDNDDAPALTCEQILALFTDAVDRVEEETVVLRVVASLNGSDSHADIEVKMAADEITALVCKPDCVVVKPCVDCESSPDLVEDILHQLRDGCARAFLNGDAEHEVALPDCAALKVTCEGADDGVFEDIVPLSCEDLLMKILAKDPFRCENVEIPLQAVAKLGGKTAHSDFVVTFTGQSEPDSGVESCIKLVGQLSDEVICVDACVPDDELVEEIRKQVESNVTVCLDINNDGLADCKGAVQLPIEETCVSFVVNKDGCSDGGDISEQDLLDCLPDKCRCKQQNVFLVVYSALPNEFTPENTNQSSSQIQVIFKGLCDSDGPSFDEEQLPKDFTGDNALCPNCPSTCEQCDEEGCPDAVSLPAPEELGIPVATDTCGNELQYCPPADLEGGCGISTALVTCALECNGALSCDSTVEQDRCTRKGFVTFSDEVELVDKCNPNGDEESCAVIKRTWHAFDRCCCECARETTYVQTIEVIIGKPCVPELPDQCCLDARDATKNATAFDLQKAKDYDFLVKNATDGCGGRIVRRDAESDESQGSIKCVDFPIDCGSCCRGDAAIVRVWAVLDKCFKTSPVARRRCHRRFQVQVLRKVNHAWQKYFPTDCACPCPLKRSEEEQYICAAEREFGWDQDNSPSNRSRSCTPVPSPEI